MVPSRFKYRIARMFVPRQIGRTVTEVTVNLVGEPSGDQIN